MREALRRAGRLRARSSREADAARRVTDPELGWPPAPLAPVLPDPVRGEGEWLPVVDDAFVNAYPNAPPAFYQTFLRVDPERPYVSVYVTLWDPRQVQLHLVMGTKEPRERDGRDRQRHDPARPGGARRVWSARFNGGFQALHGEFGMMAEGRVYLPPKPWAGTVAVFDDGRVGMGSWPGPERSRLGRRARQRADPRRHDRDAPEPHERGRGRPVQPVEALVVGRRAGVRRRADVHRALGPVPHARGPHGVPVGRVDGPRGARQGDARAALRARHSPRHEQQAHRLRVLPAAAPGRARARRSAARSTEQEYEGPIEQGLGFNLRARLAVKTMTPLRFPRYIGRDPRDFFFLTLKPVLPGPPLALADGSTVAFSTAGLPHAGWPHAFARARLPEPAPDPKRAAAAGSCASIRGARCPSRSRRPQLDHPLARLAGRRAPAAEGPVALYAVRERGLLALRHRRAAAPMRSCCCAASCCRPSTPPRARSAIDAEGFLLYAEARQRPRRAFTTADRARAAPIAHRAARARPGSRSRSTDAQRLGRRRARESQRRGRPRAAWPRAGPAAAGDVPRGRADAVPALGLPAGPAGPLLPVRAAALPDARGRARRPRSGPGRRHAPRNRRAE